MLSRLSSGHTAKKESKWSGLFHFTRTIYEAAKIMANKMKIKRLSSRALHHHFIFIGFRKGTYGLSLFVYVSERMSPCFNFLSFIFAYMLSSLWLSFVLSECFVCPMRASNAVYLCNMSTLQTHRKKEGRKNNNTNNHHHRHHQATAQHNKLWHFW